MKYLLDVNVLLAAIWSNHSRHSETFAWLAGKELVVCPLSELGFLRISTNKKAINASMELARELLERFLRDRRIGRIADDIPALESKAANSDQVTDSYLVELAVRHGLTFATLDRRITHSQVEVIG